MRNETNGDERRRVVRHLLAGCARCGAVTRRIWNLAEARPPEPEGARAEWPKLAAMAGPDGERQQALLAAALHRHARVLCEDASWQEALPALRQARRLYDLLGDVPNLARLRHLEGRIEEALGEAGKAETAFLDARRAYLAEGMGSEAAALLLDLALLYTRQGRAPEIRPFARICSPSSAPPTSVREWRRRSSSSAGWSRPATPTWRCSPKWPGT